MSPLAAPRRLALLFMIAGALAAVAVSAAAAATRAAQTSPKTIAAPAVTPNTPVTRGSEYLALGDSVTFGFQEPSVVPAPNYHVASSLIGYPELVGDALHLKVTNLACPGETAASLINVTAPTFGCEGAYRKLYPLHSRYNGSQLAAAVAYLKSHSNVRLVSLMIGANDGFRCQAQTTDGCTSEFGATAAAISRHVHQIVSAIRHQAGYKGQLVVLNYYSLDYGSASVSAQSHGLNQAQDSGARPFHVRIADGYGMFATASKRFGNSPCLAGLITQTGAYGSCGVHPSYAGQVLLAHAVIAATRLP